MDLFNYLPMFPWEGPPLPRMMGVYWPFAAQTSALSSPAAPVETPAYTNEESIEFPDGFDPETFMPLRIVVHRKYKKRVE